MNTPSNGLDVRSSIRTFREWMTQRLRSTLHPERFRFVEQSLPTSPRQRLLDRRTGQTLDLEIRDAIDLRTLRGIFRYEAYTTQGLARHAALEQVYAKIIARNRTPLIIDCGANVGFASRYFSATYPQARILAIEPDTGNFDQATRNTRESSVQMMLGAVASTSARCRTVDPGLGNDGIRVELDAAGDLRTFAINELLAGGLADAGEPFIIKIDIEGFEAELFSGNLEWVDQFPLIITEIHDWMLPRKGNSRRLLECFAARDRDFIMRGENIFSISNILVS